MESEESFLTQLREKIGGIREEEFQIRGFEYEPFEKKEKEFRELRGEMIEHQKKMRKQVMINRNRSAKKEFIEHETVGNEIDIFSEDIFKRVELNENGKIKTKDMKIEEMKKEEIEDRIRVYMNMKNIRLNPMNEEKFREIMNKEDMDWKKWIQINKESGLIIKVKFIKKDTYGEVKVSMEEEEEKKVETKEERKTNINRGILMKKFK